MLQGHPNCVLSPTAWRTVFRHTQRCIPAATLAALFLVPGRGAAQPSPPSENQVKAAIVVNLPKYVEWPAGAFSASNSPIVLGIVAPPELENELRKMTAGKVVDSRKLELRRIEPGASDQPWPQILFVSGADAKPAAELLLKCQGRPVLTVVDGAINKLEGGIITLTRKDNKVRLEIDVAAAKDAQLTISSKLLGVADAVKGRGR